MIVEPLFSTSSAFSLHPDGVNCAFGDGSVRFIKDSINSWPFDTNTDWSPSLNWNSTTNSVNILPGAKVGVWQALSTRSGGECVGADQY
jgi:prepilin-type processing-associated H-X9-DG protein